MTIDKNYQKLNDIEHVLLRPGMYVGSIKLHHEDLYLLKNDKFELCNVTYNPGFIKIFDEIISNSVDEHKRNKKLNEINVNIDFNSNEISIKDNGGIPVKIHNEYKEWIPEMIFSNLKTGSNFNDEEKRTVVGTNGVGATLTNIFSKKFIIETCDTKNSFMQVYYNNMTSRDKPVISKCKKGYTKITWLTDFDRFNLNGIDDIHFKLIEKRLYDLAACNLKLKITLNDKIISFNSFDDYIKMYIDDYIYDKSLNWEFGIGKSENGFKAISFVNSVETKDGGTHVNYVLYQIITYLRERIAKKYKVDVKPAEIKQHLFLFINCTVINPSFSSQTKEKLITEIKDFETVYTISDKILNKIFTSDIIEVILDWIERKKAAEERAKLRRLNKNLDKKNILKLIDAKERHNRNKCSLFIFEGDSAMISFRKYRNVQLHGAFPIRGKFINVREIPDSKVIQNKEVQDLMGALGLKIGQKATELRYGKILIYTDSDYDGHGIAGLLVNFFGKYWPELFVEGRIIKVNTPIVVAKKDKQILSFYTDSDYLNWERKQNKLSSWNIEYKKGLAALEDDEYKEIIQNPKGFIFIKDKEFNDILELWFTLDSSNRKNKILGETIEKKSDTTYKGLF